MSQENVEIVREGSTPRSSRRANQRTLLRKVDPGFVVTPSFADARRRPLPRPGGPAADLGPNWTEDFDGLRSLDPEDFIDANDEQVVVRVHQQAVGARSRVSIRGGFLVVSTRCAIGSLVRVDISGSELQALKAVGLADQAMSQENVELVRAAFRAF